MTRKLLSLLILLGAAIFLPAQSITTAEFSGMALTADERPMPGVTITAVHTPTGTEYTVITRDDGRFNIPGVRVGGPYLVTASLEGFQDEKAADVYLRLGENKQLTFRMKLASDLGEVTVTASDEILSTAKTGAAQNITTEAIENMPSIARNFSDFTRMVPQVNIAENFSDAAYSVGGRNNRYNNVQIDGAVNNDVFGLADSGTPGGQAGTTPISLDAIQEFQVVLAPYDVRQGGFTGGGINAVTRTGSNRLHGSAFFYGRNQSFVGKGADETDYKDFTEKQMGFRLGGPVQKDKIFFFVNAEFTRRSQPNDYVIDDSGNSNDFGGSSVSVADVERFINICKNVYGYDPGSYGLFTSHRDSNKIFGRVDFNLSSAHRMTLRHNFVDGTDDILSRSGGSFTFSKGGYTFLNRTYSTVAQLDSFFGNNMANELRVNFTAIRDKREVPDLFPNVSVGVGGKYLYAGSERYSGANGLDQDIVEITDNFTLFRGAHTIVIGTHNEIFNFSNLFIRDISGTWQFSSLDNFETGKASRYEYSFSTVPGDPMWQARFKVYQLGLYAGDTWTVRPNFNLTFGLRMDIPVFGKIPSANPSVAAQFGIPTDQVPSGNILLSPRMGFNWNIFGDQKTLLRGGAGIFSGRTPYVWISNQFGNTGMEFTRYDIRSGVPKFVADPANQPKGFTGASNEIDLIDQDFKFPQVARFDIALDRELFWGFKGTVEALYTKNIKEVLYQNINLKQTGSDPFDGRPVYKSRINPGLTDVIYLTNTAKGYQYSLSFMLQKPIRSGGYFNFSYTYGQAKDQNSASSSQARSSFQYNHAGWDPNNPALTPSNQDIRHRFALGFSYNLKLIKSAPTNLTIFYNGRSGRPYSTRYYSDVNGDGSVYNDLIYVPRSADEILLQQGTWADLDKYISEDPALDAARGSIIGRNASREPWFNRADFRLLQDIPLPYKEGHKLQFSLDIMNLFNLFNKNWGKYQYVYYRGDSPLDYLGVDTATGKPKFKFSKTGQSHYDVDQLMSRWQMQLGIRYIF